MRLYALSCWKRHEISQHFQLVVYQTSKMASHRRGPWSQGEDIYLNQLVQTHGALNWVRISQLIGSRSPKQCCERYHQNLKDPKAAALKLGPLPMGSGLAMDVRAELEDEDIKNPPEVGKLSLAKESERTVKRQDSDDELSDMDSRTSGDPSIVPPPNLFSRISNRSAGTTMEHFEPSHPKKSSEPYFFICSTISKDNTLGEDARKSRLLAGYGQRLQRTGVVKSKYVLIYYLCKPFANILSEPVNIVRTSILELVYHC